MLRKNIFERYNSKKATPAEESLIESWLLNYDSKAAISEEEIDVRLAKLDRRMETELFSKAKADFSFIKVAASILLICSVSFFGYFYFSTKNLNDLPAPVGMHSTLKLASNKAIELNNIRPGDTLKGMGYVVTRLASGELKYLKASKQSGLILNTIYTKPGDLTSVILADGTKIFINANSELTYPVNQHRDYRYVQLKGEAYFEVESAAKLPGNPPFYVISKGHTIMVTGTRFNVNTYKGNYTTTLFEGRIGLTAQSFDAAVQPKMPNPRWMMPNQQYKQLDGAATIAAIENVDAVLDWKNGIFDFNELPVTEVCDKISNWYGVEFKINSDLTNRMFYGQISKTKKLSQVLNLLTMVNDLKFELKGNAVQVTKK